MKIFNVDTPCSQLADLTARHAAELLPQALLPLVEKIALAGHGVSGGDGLEEPAAADLQQAVRGRERADIARKRRLLQLLHGINEAAHIASDFMRHDVGRRRQLLHAPRRYVQREADGMVAVTVRECDKAHAGGECWAASRIESQRK